MKTTIILSFLISITITLSANENWIKIEPSHQTKLPKSDAKLDVNLSQIEPINKIMKNATVVKQLIDASTRKEKVPDNDKNWFILNSEVNK